MPVSVALILLPATSNVPPATSGGILRRNRLPPVKYGDYDKC